LDCWKADLFYSRIARANALGNDYGLRDMGELDAVSKHDILPCGCVPGSPHHSEKYGNCKLTATSVMGSGPRPAVVEMFEELNEIWYFAHPGYELSEKRG
jgi:hypothetical protein